MLNVCRFEEYFLVVQKMLPNVCHHAAASDDKQIDGKVPGFSITVSLGVRPHEIYVSPGGG